MNTNGTKNINNQISEHYCSFEVSKLLKEKGFNIGSEHYYDSELPYHGDLFYNYKDDFPTLYERPTHALAIEWIRVNFGIQISADGDCYGNEWYSKLSVVSEDLWNNLDMRHEVVSATKKFNNIHKTLDEATEAALLYTIQNLIS